MRFEEAVIHLVHPVWLYHIPNLEMDDLQVASWTAVRKPNLGGTDYSQICRFPKPPVAISFCRRCLIPSKNCNRGSISSSGTDINRRSKAHYLPFTKWSVLDTVPPVLEIIVQRPDLGQLMKWSKCNLSTTSRIKPKAHISLEQTVLPARCWWFESIH
jgi:hypothetical protein